jgi:hypothetical protein
MKLFSFPRKSPPPGWQADELQKVSAACAAAISGGEASGWELGSTESGDPQLYLLGPAPEHECILCISRLGHRYVLEDGHGGIVFEHDSLVLLAEQVYAALRRGKGTIIARVAIAWHAVRELWEEKAEPILAEPAELLTHVAPQFAAFA